MTRHAAAKTAPSPEVTPVGILPQHGVDRPGQAVGSAEAAPPGPVSRIDLVDAALDPSSPARAHLVAHGVGECLHWVRTRHSVAVEVEQRVQLGERESSVPLQDREAGRTQWSTPQEPVRRGEGAEHWMTTVIGSAPVVLGDSRPQRVAHLFKG